MKENYKNSNAVVSPKKKNILKCFTWYPTYRLLAKELEQEIWIIHRRLYHYLQRDIPFEPHLMQTVPALITELQ